VVAVGADLAVSASTGVMLGPQMSLARSGCTCVRAHLLVCSLLVLVLFSGEDGLLPEPTISRSRSGWM
jgi:hypothetical protein